MTNKHLDHFIEVLSLPPTTALPLDIIIKSVMTLPKDLVQIVDEKVFIQPRLAASYNRVVATNFTETFWNLADEQNRLDTVNWCALGGSFLADFAMDKAKPRIFAWGLNPHYEATHYAVNALKGRDASRIPTAACVLAENVHHFVNTDCMDITHQQLVDYMSLGPAGIRIVANNQVPSHYQHDARVQFIIPGVASLYANLISDFLKLTGYPLMGITSGNFSAKGKYRSKSGGTHKNLDEIQKNMGFLGVPILAGPVTGLLAEKQSLPELYQHLHSPYLALNKAEKEQCTDLLPTSVTVINPNANGDTWEIVRHGSLHHSVIQAKLKKYHITVKWPIDERLEIGLY